MHIRSREFVAALRIGNFIINRYDFHSHGVCFVRIFAFSTC